jgi:hypothetical protein
MLGLRKLPVPTFRPYPNSPLMCFLSLYDTQVILAEQSGCRRINLAKQLCDTFVRFEVLDKILE